MPDLRIIAGCCFEVLYSRRFVQDQSCKPLDANGSAVTLGVGKHARQDQQIVVDSRGRFMQITVTH
ncbi:hypothetical protein PLANPX_5283 [Lacipirellula parvula]|uniref:Uncharacterized protein n=1 Tax=Lacipirellula parvula TaxID=2650471 RepID=A0A5K7XKH6_9BACT|nr:hypothetical protein PLANPX_5283 [Lacipirellula parvula]